jgi:YggT family protein|tara:strand:- start:2485 stop:2733 length:249 start_codon:yes stop_codon:yes gene_type:complete
MLYFVINSAADLLQILVLARVILSWLPDQSGNKYVMLVYGISEQVLRPIRENLPIQGGGFDFSPIVAFFLIGFIKKLLLVAI